MFFKKSSLVESAKPAPQTEATLLPEAVPISLDAVLAIMSDVLRDLEMASADVDVARAKWADLCRDLGMSPFDPLELDALTTQFDRAAAARMALIVVMLERGAIARDVLTRILDKRIRAATKGGIIEPVQASQLVTLDLLVQSPLRREELARRVILGFGASIRGEKLNDSRAALERLDYGRLMAEANRARQALRDQGNR